MIHCCKVPRKSCIPPDANNYRLIVLCNEKKESRVENEKTTKLYTLYMKNELHLNF